MVEGPAGPGEAARAVGPLCRYGLKRTQPVLRSNPSAGEISGTYGGCPPNPLRYSLPLVARLV